MNYQKVYESLIERAQTEGRKKVKGGAYFEEHHIKPRCIGGNNKKDNRVFLTAKEHFISHLLLCEIYPKSDGLRSALWLLVNAASKGQKRHKVSARTYERIKIVFAEQQRRRIQGKEHSLANPEMIKKCTEAKLAANVKRPDLGQSNKKQATCPHCGKTGGANTMKRWHFDNCPTFTGKPRKHREVECPHCGHKSQPMVISKYHGDNCKLIT